MVHTRTAIHEAFGTSASLTMTADRFAPLNYGPGGARLLNISATAGLKLKMPDARLLRTGPAVITVYNSGANSVSVTTNDGATLIVNLLAGRIVELHLTSTATANGTWIAEGLITPSVGSSITIGRTPMNLSIDFYTNNGVNLRTLADRNGYTGNYPLALKVEIPSQITLGAPNATTPALDTGVFYAGTTILLVNRGKIYAAGGTGGNGGSTGSGAGSAGQAGGTALYARHSVRLVNTGTIAGGGGGGGGGQGGVSAQGGGGGGGAGGLPGTGGTGANAGGTGTDQVGGIRGAGGTGASDGGNGGQIGGAGSAGSGGSGGAGGAAGYSLRSAGGGPVITIITGGTRYGSEALT